MLGPPLLVREAGFPLEVEDQEVPLDPEELAEVVVAVAADLDEPFPGPAGTRAASASKPGRAASKASAAARASSGNRWAAGP